MKSKRDGFFWVSYTDVMITLFFVMLAIAAISVYQLDEQVRTTEDKLQRIKDIEKTVTDLEKLTTSDGKKLFTVSNNRFETRSITFSSGQYAIDESDKPYLREVGEALKNLVSKAKDGSSYLIVIEGGADPDGGCWNDVFALSYRRSYELWALWVNQGIDLKVPGKSDVQISGSGDQIPTPCPNDVRQDRERVEDFRTETGQMPNKDDLRRFIIHVRPLIPKVDEIK